MAADVVFTAESPWYTNSYTWNRITEYAESYKEESPQGKYQEYLDVLGVDFTLLPDDKAVEVAKWLSEVIEGMLAGHTAGFSEPDRVHVQELVRKLNSEIEARNH